MKKMFNIFDDQGNANQSYIEIPSYSSQNDPQWKEPLLTTSGSGN
jgi:hypothetical protein